MGGEESECLIVCAGQRVAQEGSSPSGALVESTVSESGGNASLAVACGVVYVKLCNFRFMAEGVIG